ncbi:TIGR03032 family protein [Dyella acidisoli]|uniref:TIGR03032 family protein n=1 Tax=Dyella acidisoli TaxID=1867834 RepID=UPI0024E1101F|nr:TIGR03032 family protein [Dyella acidisoli]
MDNETGADEQSPLQEPVLQQEEVRYSFSNGLIALLSKLNIALAFTSYQSGLLYLLGRRQDGGAHLHQSEILKPMGIAIDKKGGMVLCCDSQIIRFENVLEYGEKINDSFDACYMPRTIHLTGRLDAHDIDVDSKGRSIFVNTQFNCLATVSARHSFELIWKPPFISQVVSEDRCHLNGLAMADGKPAYVTAVSRSDTIDGWRDRRSDGGIVMDVTSNRVLCEGLSMPHSPRVHNGALWVLNSGTGELGKITGFKKKGIGKFEPIVFCPGFLRGLAFYDKYAFVGLSRPRYKRFEGLELDARLKQADSEPWTGIHVIDLEKRSCVNWFRIDGPVAELYDVAVVPGCSRPMVVSPNSPEASSLITLPQALKKS